MESVAVRPTRDCRAFARHDATTRGERPWVLLGALGRDRGGAGGGGGRVEVFAARDRRLQVFVEAVHQGDAGGEVQVRDVVVADVVQVLHEGAKRVAVGGDQNRAAGAQLRLDLNLPV